MYYLGPSDHDVDDVRRLVLQALEPASKTKTKVHWLGASRLEQVTRSPVDVGTGLPLNQRATEWMRWNNGTKRKAKRKSEALKLLPVSDPAIPRTWDGSRFLRFPGTENSIYQFLCEDARKETLTASQSSNTLQSFWSKDVRNVMSAVVGQVLYPKDAPHPKDFKQQSTSRHEFLTTAPGVCEFLAELRPESTNLKHQEELVIRLTPSELSEPQSTLTNDLPNLEIRIAIDIENRAISVHNAILILLETQSDLLLPNAPMDLRFVSESFLIAGEQVDQRIHNFVDASNLNIWGQDRLKTPASLTLSIPSYAIGSRSSTATADPNSEIQVTYAFAGLSHRSFIHDKFSELDLDYSIIEAGRTGGRREELRLSLPEIVDSSCTKESFLSLFEAAHDLVQEITFPEAGRRHKREGSYGINRRPRGRRLVRRRLSTGLRASKSGYAGVRRMAG